MYPYGLIGNGQLLSLVNAREASVDWLCLPRPDSPPVFGALLDPEGGRFGIRGPEGARYRQAYVENTNVLQTFVEGEGGSFVVTDFFPRFEQHGRIYRPLSLFRIVERIAGSPQVSIAIDVVDGWEKRPVAPTRGNSHLRWEIGSEQLRLTTNASLTRVLDGTPGVLSEPLYFVLTWGSPFEEDLAQISRDQLDRTIRYWRRWVKHCTIPSDYQNEAIRSALALKLHCYEDTGAILAAATTSLPEEIGGVRNWDYRFCWLRDSYFVLSALNRLGHFEEMEGFLKFLIGVLADSDVVAPVYRLDGSAPLPEISYPAWRGWGASSPVRVGNQAAEHVQNDAYGELALSLLPLFVDARFRHLLTPEIEALVGKILEGCRRSIGQPDAGLWEFRDGWKEHTFTNLLCWAGLDRYARLREKGSFEFNRFDLSEARSAAAAAVRRGARSGSLRSAPSDPSADAALLQALLLRFPDRELGERTLEVVRSQLLLGDSRTFLYRYRHGDDFGKPQSAFVICSYWLVQALVAVGRREEAREIFEETLTALNPLGLLSEHYDPATRRQLGNFPQCYSHVGLLNAAFAVSPPWSEIL